MLLNRFRREYNGTENKIEHEPGYWQWLTGSLKSSDLHEAIKFMALAIGVPVLGIFGTIIIGSLICSVNVLLGWIFVILAMFLIVTWMFYMFDKQMCW